MRRQSGGPGRHDGRGGGSSLTESPLVPTSVSQRPARADELAALQKLLSEAPTSVTRLKRGVANAVLLWAVSLLAVVAAWLALGWIAGKAFDINLGLNSTATLALVGVATPLCAVVAAFSSVRWIRTWPDHRAQLRDDVAQSRVNEERYVFSEAKRFQEPEHGGLIYFLRSDENEVFTVFDDESQSLGIDDKDPLQSRYRPQSHLVIVRAPKSRIVLGSQFSGSELAVARPIELGVPPKEWPEDEQLCAIPWEQLEQRLGSAAAAATI